MFEKEYREIIELMKRNEDYAVMRAICENIIDVLKENGVKVNGTIIKNVTRTETFAIVDNFEVKFNGLDFTEHDKEYIDEINVLKKQISELESELVKKETLLKMREGFYEECKEKSIIEKLKATPIIEEPLPFSSNEYEEDFPEELRSKDLNFNLVSKMLDVIELMLTDTQS